MHLNSEIKFFRKILFFYNLKKKSRNLIKVLIENDKCKDKKDFYFLIEVYIVNKKTFFYFFKYKFKRYTTF